MSVWTPLSSANGLAGGLNTERLDPEQLQTLHDVLQTLKPVLEPQQQNGTAILLTWDQLYAPLAAPQRAFLDAFRSLDAQALGSTAHHFGELTAAPEVVPVGQQMLHQDQVSQPLPPQYLPRDVLQAYSSMMDAMQQQLGKRLYVESGYRSPAYQLYLFLGYLSNHDYSIRETNRYVALPGHSEHGYPPRQAIDFINQQGISGENHPEEFEALPEYGWLQQHARDFGFFLSYPRNNASNTAFEPWHWHYEPPQEPPGRRQ